MKEINVFVLVCSCILDENRYYMHVPFIVNCFHGSITNGIRICLEFWKMSIKLYCIILLFRNSMGSTEYPSMYRCHWKFDPTKILFQLQTWLYNPALPCHSSISLAFPTAIPLCATIQHLQASKSLDKSSNTIINSNGSRTWNVLSPV